MNRLTQEEIVSVFCACIPLVVRENPIPKHNSALTGAQYYRELLETNNPSRFRNAARMDRATFHKLLRLLSEEGGLTCSETMSSGEKLMILLHIIAGWTIANTAERWQHSESTISLKVHELIACFMRAQLHFFIKPLQFTTPAQISTNRRFANYFTHCIGALDGSHIPAIAPVEIQGRFRNRKGTLTQNILGVVNFDMTFSYLLCGWEGSAHDGKVLLDALTKNLTMYEGKYYLGDAGYSLTKYCLTPYRGVRYHLKEWRLGNRAPQNKEELFNLRHSSLRNVVERTFGIIKQRFPILKTMHSFSIPTQIELVMCCGMVHNFIRRNQGYEDEFDNDQWREQAEEENRHEQHVNGNQTAAEDAECVEWRDQIAQAMWDDYVEYMRTHGGRNNL